MQPSLGDLQSLKEPKLILIIPHPHTVHHWAKARLRRIPQSGQEAI